MRSERKEGGGEKKKKTAPKVEGVWGVSKEFLLLPNFFSFFFFLFPEENKVSPEQTDGKEERKKGQGGIRVVSLLRKVSYVCTLLYIR